MSSDLKDIIKLLSVLVVLIVLSWLVSFFSNYDNHKRLLLFPNHELSSMETISVQKINYSKTPAKNAYTISENQWEKIKSDLSSIYVQEFTTEPSAAVLQEFSKETPSLTITSKKSSVTYSLGEINTDTGNFWMKAQNSESKTAKYYLCRSEIYFEGFYQTELEGHSLSYHRFANYFTQPFRSWYGRNFWSNAKSLSLKTEKNTLFFIDRENLAFSPTPPIEIEIKKEFMQNYISLVSNWIPTQVQVVSDHELKELNTTNDFILEIKLDNDSTVKLTIATNGLIWKEQKLFFAASKEFLDQLVILPDNFYQEKISSLEKIWEELQLKPETNFQWINLKTKKQIVRNYSIIQKNLAWKNFFCFIAGCFDEGHTPLMKIKQIPESAYKQWAAGADYQLVYNKQNYYFIHTPFKLQVLTPLGYEFNFISRIKDIYPNSP